MHPYLKNCKYITLIKNYQKSSFFFFFLFFLFKFNSASSSSLFFLSSSKISFKISSISSSLFSFYLNYYSLKLLLILALNSFLSDIFTILFLNFYFPVKSVIRHLSFKTFFQKHINAISIKLPNHLSKSSQLKTKLLLIFRLVKHYK